MSSLESRLTRLEAEFRPMPPVLTFVCDGETPEAVIRRAGHDPEDPAYIFLAICIVDPPPYRN